MYEDNNQDFSEVNQEKEANEKGTPLKGKVMKYIGVAAAAIAVFGIIFISVKQLSGGMEKEEAELPMKKAVISTEANSNANVSTTKVSAVNGNQATDVSEVVENTMPSIVSITSTISQQGIDVFGQGIDQEAQGSGSGIIVGKNKSELLIVTNNHVVQDAKIIKVIFIDEKKVTAEVKGTDSTADLAVIAVKLSDIKKDTLNKIQIASLGNSDDIKVGQMAIAIGNALGYGQSVTVGYISAKNREVDIDGKTMTLLQTDAAINPGNSGGALLNISGQLIGINSVKYASSEVEGMGYAIPISSATPIINELMNREKLKNNEKGYLGVSGTPVSEADNEKYKIPIGVYVADVSKDGAAKTAGIKSGDIITKVNGIEVKTVESLQEKVNSYRIGKKVTLTIMRSNNGTYKEKEVKVELKGSKTLKDIKDKEEQSDTKYNSVPRSSQPNQGSEGSISNEDIFNYFFNNN